MLYYGILLLILASLSWSLLDILRKKLVQNMEPLALTTALCIGQACLFSLVALFANPGFPEPAYWLWGVIGATLALFAALGLNLSLHVSPLSQSIPMLSLTPAFAVLNGFLLLDEKITVLQGIGLVASTIGAAGFGLDKGWTKAKGAYMMVGVAFLLAMTMAVDKRAVQHAEVVVHACFQACFISICLVLYVALRGRIKTLQPVLVHNKKYFLAVLAFALAVGLQLEAVKYLHVSVLEAVKRCIGLFSSIFAGYLIFSEAITAKKIYSAFLLAIGVLFLLFL